MLTVEGSDGRAYKQLVKMAHTGLDDTRQDAIMQQLFCLVNRFLASAAQTRARRLRIRTYKARETRGGFALFTNSDDYYLINEKCAGYTLDAPCWRTGVGGGHNVCGPVPHARAI